MQAVVTVFGKDNMGIVHAVSGLMLQHQLNILDIKQTLMQGYFTMIMMVDLSKQLSEFTALLEDAKQLGDKMGLNIHIQHQEIFNAMHQI